MNIVCPHCTTFYAIDPASLGPGGRTVRCARCKEVWVARPETAPRADILAPSAMAAGPGSGWDEPERAPTVQRDDTPVVDSPSIASDMPGSAGDTMATIDVEAQTPRVRTSDGQPPRKGWLRRRAPRPPKPRRAAVRLPVACFAMATLTMALIVWRAEIVRLLPQTAQFYKLVGLEVNLRGLAFRDVKVMHETADDKPVLVIEGGIVDTGRKPVELPRLRFIVRDAKGVEIYAWNAVLEQPVLKPGEKAWFRSRLASPPPEGRSIDVRFFNKRDLLASGL
ncbi:MAG: thioredoxin [Rhizobiales bacterium 62-47]|nr:zinc-ribbon domain-containing protein [Hyphomicrobiales bacterium]OJY14436.1 MAG: thioredoxin [Rhizobiales bacterium 62-47]